MITRRKILSLVLLATVAGLFSNTSILIGQVFQASSLNNPGSPVFVRSSGLGRGVNFGNMLEAPNEGDWGLFVEEAFFDRAVEAGLDHIRLPVSWTHHADQNSPYTIDPTFFSRVDWVVEQALERGLKIIVNVHHYDELNNSPVAEWDRALGIWQQIAERYQSKSDADVYFEILNEPHGQFNQSPELWNQFVAAALTTLRQTNPSRKVLVGPVFFNSVNSLETFELPEDSNLIATVHYYAPFEFTHQGAEWFEPVPPIGVSWDGETVGLSNPWQNWSWNTTVDSTSSGLKITYNEGFAGFQVHNPSPIENGQELSFIVDRAMNLTVAVKNIVTGDQQEYSVSTTDGQQTYTIDIADYGSNNKITNIFLQNASPNAQPTFTMTNFQIRVGKLSLPLISTEAERVRQTFAAAFKWGLRNRVPLYLGEFGAYKFGDNDSRVRWTTAVRATAESFRIDWGYWELAAGFGFYDPDNEVFRLPLLQALVPEFE